MITIGYENKGCYRDIELNEQQIRSIIRFVEESDYTTFSHEIITEVEVISHKQLDEIEELGDEVDRLKEKVNNLEDENYNLQEKINKLEGYTNE